MSWNYVIHNFQCHTHAHKTCAALSADVVVVFVVIIAAVVGVVVVAVKLFLPLSLLIN